MRMTYDAKADSAYLYLGPIGKGEVTGSQHILADNSPSEINLDFDADGKLLGIEILLASKILKRELLQIASQL